MNGKYSKLTGQNSKSNEYHEMRTKYYIYFKTGKIKPYFIYKDLILLKY